MWSPISSLAVKGSAAQSELTQQQAGVTSAPPFSDLFSEEIGEINALETQARSAVDGLMAGTGVDVHEAMIASEKASMAFELALSIRNKAVQAYQQVIGMQF